jgi:hypothetical protein
MRMLLVILGLTACSGGGSGGGAVSPDQIAGVLGHATCAKLSTCCTQQEFKDQTLGSTSEAQCDALFAGLIDTVFTKTLKSSIDAGRVIYHGDRLGDCIAVIDSVSCTEYQALNNGAGSFIGSGCDDPFEGQVAIGGDCANDFDCTSEFCSGDSTDTNGNITFGKCIVEPTPGQPCDHAECGRNAFCDNPMCVALKPDGASCVNKDECVSNGCNGGPGTCGPSMTCDGN